MPRGFNIALTAPSSKGLNRYFSLRLKKSLYNEPSEYNPASKILVVSDIEGNFLAFRRILLKNGVINKGYEWQFGDGHLVILGDCFDRGEQVIECLWLIYSLEEKARAKNGYVHFILGNHEIMNLNGDWRYVHPRYAENTKSNRGLTALYDGNSELWRWLLTKNIIEKIGDMIFVHGGISEELLNLNISVEDLNRLVRPYYTQANNYFTDPLLHIVFNTDFSPFWYRGYYQENIEEKLVDKILSKFNVNTIITGHTTVEKVTSFFNHKIINVDTNHAIGNSEALLLRQGHLYRVLSDGEKQLIK